jgi:peptidoglycan-N-acetylglucosamine deacetylase
MHQKGKTLSIKNAILTIDDAPSTDMQSKVDFLLWQSIPAVWFCHGDFLEKRPHLALDAIRKGFVIANHAYDHPHFSDLTIEDGCEQIRRTDAIIETLYRQAGISVPFKAFRFPYGDKGGLKYSEVLEPYSAEGAARKGAFQDCLQGMGYTPAPSGQITYQYYFRAGLQHDRDWYWTYDVHEWSIHHEPHAYSIDSLEKVFARMDEDEPESGRGLNRSESAEIVLIHDHTQTTPYFKNIIQHLLAKGITFSLPG